MVIFWRGARGFSSACIQGMTASKRDSTKSLFWFANRRTSEENSAQLLYSSRATLSLMISNWEDEIGQLTACWSAKSAKTRAYRLFKWWRNAPNQIFSGPHSRQMYSILGEADNSRKSSSGSCSHPACTHTPQQLHSSFISRRVWHLKQSGQTLSC